ncbi:MAG: YdcF family protein [Smithellaceae bacterium]
MEDLYTICKSFTDPVLVIFILFITAFIFCFMGSKKKSGILILGLAILLLYGLSIAPVANYLAYSLEKDYFRTPVPVEKNIEVIVVLGGGAHDISALNNTFASEASAARLVHGVEVFNKYGAKYLICAGKGAAKMSEAEVMAQMALALGVPKEKIRIDDKSNNTWEHAVELNKMFANKKIYIGIVTSGYHMKRSEKEFKKYFSNIVPLSASYSYSSPATRNVLNYIPQTAALNATATALREITGFLWYEIKSI